jgi:hypothetical protein
LPVTHKGLFSYTLGLLLALYYWTISLTTVWTICKDHHLAYYMAHQYDSFVKSNI